MKIKEVFPDMGIMINMVPLAIGELGLAYLNDIGLWNITINWKNSNCHNKTITAAQLLDIFEHHVSCYPNQESVMEAETAKMIALIKLIDPSVVLEA